MFVLLSRQCNGRLGRCYESFISMQLFICKATIIEWKRVRNALKSNTWQCHPWLVIANAIPKINFVVAELN